MTPIVDPRLGDAEDDASSPKRRSLLALTGSLLAEVSLPKLTLASVIMVALPAVLLGLAPLIASAWYAMLSGRIASALTGIWPLLLLAAALVLSWTGGRTLFRAAERSFWSLNALAVQPGYALCREGLRHFAEAWLPPHAGAESRARLRAAAAAGTGLVLCGIALGVVALAWPASRWVGEVADFAFPHRLVVPALANSVVLVGLYLAAASLVWGTADAGMDQPRDLAGFDPLPPGARTWRVAHLSDLHAVGGRYEFRIESGRSGPRGNEILQGALARLDEVDAQRRVDLVLITGDMTDAGRSAEWAEFLAALDRHPRLAERTLILPGNHDLNVVDRANPARLELPTSPGKRLRQIRTLSAIAAVQGDKVRVVERATGRLGGSLAATLAPHSEAIREFADTGGGLRRSLRLARLWEDVFPMVLPPDEADGLGVVLLNSNAESHFSFTNALGLVPAMQARGLMAVARQFPRARWIVALHHHLVEYPRPVAALSERIGTALINGSWFVRQLRSLDGSVVAMHGHRHVDWIGKYGGTRIVSAPSPVMGTGRCFHVHALAAGPGRRLCLLAPERVEIPRSLPEPRRVGTARGPVAATGEADDAI